MRVFVGIKASPKFAKKILVLQKEIKDFPIRLITENNLHITVVPPWYEEKNETTISSLTSVKFQEIKLNFDKFYINSRNKVIWFEATTVPETLIKLRTSIYRSLNIKNEARTFRVHCTIARFKNNLPVREIKTKEFYFTEKIKSFCLFQSVPNPKGTSYKIIKEFKVRK